MPDGPQDYVIRLNGLAASADDNWRVSYVKITYGSDTLVDRAWNLLFDNDNRSYELYRRAFDPTRGGRMTTASRRSVHKNQRWVERGKPFHLAHDTTCPLRL